MALNVSLPYHQLIGAPIVAMIQAEALAAQASSDFIETVGFVRAPNDEDPDSFGHLRAVTFTFNKQDVNGAVVKEEIQLPVLSLVPIPLLQIRDATLEFELKLTDVVEEPRPRRRERRAILRGMYATRRGVGNRSTANVDMTVKLNIVQSDIPVGLTKLFQVLDVGVRSKEVTT